MEEQAIRTLCMMHMNSGNGQVNYEPRSGYNDNMNTLLTAVYVLSPNSTDSHDDINNSDNADGMEGMNRPRVSKEIDIKQFDYAFEDLEGELRHHDSSPNYVIDNENKSKKMKRSKSLGNENQECYHCHSKGTPEWRRGPDGDRTLCNACGLFYAKLIKRYGIERAIEIMINRRESGKVNDRRISVG